MKKLIHIVAAVAAVLTFATPALAQRVGPRNFCVSLGELVSAGGMDSSQSFTLDEEKLGGYDVVSLYISLTDANTSITRFDMGVTASFDGNTNDYTLQSVSVASGVGTSSDVSWRKASPGSAKWVWRIDSAGFEDLQVTFSVGAGAGASIDLLTVTGRACVGG